MLAVGLLMAAASVAQAETRTLKLYFIHTKERAEITYKRNGRYDAGGLTKVNKFLRDWRRNEPTKMDPRLLDLVWETYQAAGARDYIHVVSAYRSPATNSMLRSRSKGVANKSQHMLGKAIDFYVPGVSLKRLRDAGLRMQVGGVGYYPRSGSPFVHLDVGNVRHWPRMSRKELVAVFPKGKTLHVPSDGKPLPGFEQAMASYETRKKKGGGAVAYASAAPNGKAGGKGLFATLFGGGADEEEDNGGAAVASAAAPKAKPAKPVAAKPAPEKPAAKKAVAKEEKKRAPAITIVPPELAEPAQIARPAEPVQPQVVEPEIAEPVIAEPEMAETLVASLPARMAVPSFAPRALPEAPVEDVPFGIAEASAPEATPIVEDAAQAPVDVALSVPLPSWRPAASPAPALAAAPAEDPMLLALAAPGPRADAVAETASRAPIPGSRTEAPVVEVASIETAGAQPGASPLELFAFPEPRPEPAVAPAALADRVELPAETRRTRDRIAALAAAESVQPELRRAEPETDPAPTASVRTTKKSARPNAKAAKPARKPQVVAAEPRTARWALFGDPVATNVKGTTAPALAYNIVRTAPVEVYTAGFERRQETAPTDRFSGKAVKFLSVAKFATN